MARAKLPFTVVYPGSFDPLTLGHLDIIERAHKMFKEVVVAVAEESGKEPLFSIKERIEFIKRAIRKFKGVKTEKLEGLLVDFSKRHNAKAIIRGLRAVSDFEYEFKMAWMNRRLAPNLETIFLIPSEKYAYLASSLVKEIAALGGTLHKFVPPFVAKRLKEVERQKAKGEGRKATLLRQGFGGQEGEGQKE